MAVSGAPEKTPDHACNIADLALSFIETVQKMTDGSENDIQIRIGEFFRSNNIMYLNDIYTLHRYLFSSQGYRLANLIFC